MKTNYFKNLLLLVLIGLSWSSLEAQVNIARASNATFTGTGGNALYSITRVNDGQINPCGFLEAWLSGAGGSTAQWMQGTFNQSEDINAIRIWVAEKDNRYLSGATIQVWDGSIWIDHYTYVVPYDDVNRQNNLCDYVVKFPRVTTDRFRVTKWVMQGGQKSNPDFREVEVYNLKGHDAGITNISPLFKAGNQVVLGTLKNIGNNGIDSVNVEWSVNGVMQTSTKQIFPNKLLFADTYQAFKDTLLSLGSYNFIAQTAYTVKAWSSLPNGMIDSIKSNDTFSFKFTAVGKPAPPVVEDQVYCGVTAPLLKGKGVPNSQLNWYADALGTKFIATGDSVQLKTLRYPTDTIPYYGRSAITLKLSHKLAPMSGVWSYTGGASPQDKGVYVNIKPKFDILLDSLDVGFTAPNTALVGPHNFDVYYKVGGHAGSETNASAWTLAASSSATLNITPQYGLRIDPVRLSAGRIILKANTQYSLYIKIKDVDQSVRTNCAAGSYENNTTKFENEVLIVEEGALSVGNFSSIAFLGGFVPEVYYYYELFFESDSAIANIYVHPKPTGAAIKVKAGSKGTAQAGTKGNPDFVTNGEKIEYVFTPPTGYTNANFGTKWTITAFTIETQSGTKINSLDTVSSMPSASDSGRLSITPRLTEVDSVFKITMVIRDLGPYNCDSIIERWVYVAPRPFANFLLPKTTCDGEGVFFDNKSTIESGNMFYKWYFMNTSNVILDSTDAFNPVYTFPTYGTYKVRLIAISTKYFYTDDTTITITIGEIPTINVKVINACEGIPVSFVNNTTASTSVPTFKWNFGDGATSILKSPSHLYANAGGYQVKLIATANGCASEKVINAYQFAKPISNFVAPTGQLCSGDEVQFNNTTTISGGTAGAFWDFNDQNEISTDINPKFRFSKGGAFSIKLISVSEFGCKDSISKNVQIKLAPKADYSANSFCAKEPTIFTNKSTDGGPSPSINWDFGDGTTSIQDNPIHNWTSIGPKVVKFKITSQNGCFAMLEKNFEVLPQPIADFNVGVACSGQEIAFENRSSVEKGELSYTWDLGDGSVSNVGAPRHVYTVSVSTSLNVKLTAIVPNGCPSSIAKPINIEPTPVCGFTKRDTFISGLGRGVYFRATAQTGVKYDWLLGDDGNGPNKADFFHQFTYFKPYNVSLIVSNGAGCNCRTEQTVQNSPTSVNSIAGNDIKVYPNPTNNIVNIEGSDIEYVKVFNAEGKLVYESAKVEVNNTIDVSDWAAGVYQVEVKTLKGSSVVKLVKY